MAPSSASMFLLHIHDHTKVKYTLQISQVPVNGSCYLALNSDDILNRFYLPASKVKRVASRP